MALLTVLTRDSTVREALRPPRGPRPGLASARSWEGLLRLVRERPVTSVVLDSEAFGPDQEPEEAVAELRRLFPSVGVVFVHRPQLDPLTLFRLGRAGIEGLVLVRSEGLVEALQSAMSRCRRQSTASLVLSAIGGALPMREIAVVKLALSGAQLAWSADELARRTGVSRAHLSVRLRTLGLPSAGHLLLWAKLLHAGRWLADPGRSAESISRQLEYSSGAAFRRALQNYVGCTPTEARALGGLPPVLSAFLDACGLGDTVGIGRSVA